MPSERAHQWLCAGAYRLKACVHDEYFKDLSSGCCSRYEIKNSEEEVEIQVDASDIVKPHFAELIAKDVPRSWSGIPEHDCPQLRADLAEVLLSFSVHNPRIGYCQGMSFICALALTEMEKELAFWFLVYVVRSLPWNFFHETAKVEVSLFMEIIETHAPKIRTHFDGEENLVPAMNYFLVPCFVPMFVYVLPVSTTLGVWDLIFQKAQDGDELILTLHRVAFALLSIHSGRLLSRHREHREALTEAIESGYAYTKSDICLYYEAKVEETSGVLFVQKIFQLAKADKDVDRLVLLATELTICSRWLLRNRISTSVPYETTAANRIQRLARDWLRRKCVAERMEKWQHGSTSTDVSSERFSSSTVDSATSYESRSSTTSTIVSIESDSSNTNTIPQSCDHETPRKETQESKDVVEKLDTSSVEDSKTLESENSCLIM